MQHELLWLELAEYLGPRSAAFRPLLDAFGTPEAIFAADESALREVLSEHASGTIRALLRRRKEKRAKEISLYCHRAGVRVLPYDHADYPTPFREISDPPVLVYCRGRLPDFDKFATVGVVGPRKADAYGESVAYKLSFEMAAAGAVIVSGLADGIDGIATAGALAAGGTSVAIFGCGIDRIYPAHHTKLCAECIEHGAVITEYAPGTPPNRQNFPMRNRLISALSRAVLVAEAPEISGSLITARYAILQGKPLFAVPGDITSPHSVGSNLLLQAGARPAMCAEDILHPLLPRYHATLSPKALKEAQQYSELTPDIFRRFGMRSSADKGMRRRHRATAENVATSVAIIGEGGCVKEESKVADVSMLTPRQREIYRMMPSGRFAVDALTEQGIPTAEAIGTLTVFEVYGLVRQAGGGLYQKK